MNLKSMFRVVSKTNQRIKFPFFSTLPGADGPRKVLAATDGKIMAVSPAENATNEVGTYIYDVSRAPIGSDPLAGVADVKPPEIAGVFPTSPVKATVTLDRRLLIKLLQCSQGFELKMTIHESYLDAVYIKFDDGEGLIMPKVPS